MSPTPSPQSVPPDPSNIKAARVMVGSMIGGLAASLLVGTLLAPPGDGADRWAIPTLWQGLVLVTGLGAVALAAAFPQLSPAARNASTPGELRAAVMSSLVLGMAMCEAPGILGFACSMIDPKGSLVTLLIGALLSLPAAFLLAWPSRRTIGRLTAPAKPEVRRELLNAWFGEGAVQETPAGGGITRY